MKSEELHELESLYKEVYDTEYFFDPNDISPILKLSRESAPIESLRNVTERFIRSFTLPIPEHGVHYDGSFVYAIAGSGKTIFVWQLIYRLWQKYGDDLNSIVNYGPMVEGTNYFNDKKVQLLICDDALSNHSKKEKNKEATKLLAKIRHVYDNYDDSINGIIYVIFVSQSIYDLELGVRRQLTKRVYKSLSGLHHDNTHSIKPDIGLQAFNVLSKIHLEITEKANNAYKAFSIVSFVSGVIKNNVGYIHFDYDLDEIAKAKEITTIIDDSTENTTYTNNLQKNYEISNLSDNFWFDILPIFLKELYANKSLLEKARKMIGISTLERNIELWYKRQFERYEYPDLVDPTININSKDNARIYCNDVKNFLRETHTFKADLSEEFFLKKIQNSTVSPPLLASRKTNLFFDSSLSTQHPDIYLSIEGRLVALLAVKMHEARETCSVTPEVHYSKKYSLPCYLLCLEEQSKKAIIRFGPIETEKHLQELADGKEMKIKDTVELVTDWQKQVIDVLARDLLPPKGEEK